MRRALDWLVVDALGQVAGVDPRWLPCPSRTGVVLELGVAANDDSVRLKGLPVEGEWCGSREFRGP
ncbi:hypothetical protein [Herbaspirillum sp. B65]|uniref:hypothetical protein n=1 Tax=Herbaspirillum sp. B65 TaxID=137708 RepID=UPI000346537C|nr:hypothetical protein [Herbaspirillum sp. B65]